MRTETQNDPFSNDDVSFLDFGSDDIGETPDLHTIPEQEAKLSEWVEGWSKMTFTRSRTDRPSRREQ